MKRMGILMKEVRAWLYEAEQCIKLASLQEDPQKETKIQEKIEVSIKYYKISLHYFSYKLQLHPVFSLR